MTCITMVIPTYNDLKSLSSLIEEIENSASGRIRYLLVDNGSNQEGVASILNQKSNHWTSIRLPQNKGFGGGIKAGIRAANTEWVGWMPGNLKILPPDVESLIESIEIKTGTLIKCHRKRKSISAKLKTFSAGLIQSTLTRSLMFDTGGTPTICEKDFFEGILDLPDDYVIESRVLFEARKLGMNVLRPQIPYGERKFGASHWQKGLKSEIALMKSIITNLRNARQVKP